MKSLSPGDFDPEDIRRLLLATPYPRPWLIAALRDSDAEIVIESVIAFPYDHAHDRYTTYYSAHRWFLRTWQFPAEERRSALDFVKDFKPLVAALERSNAPVILSFHVRIDDVYLEMLTDGEMQSIIGSLPGGKSDKSGRVD